MKWKKGPVGVGKAVATVDGEVALTAELTVYGRLIRLML